MNSIQVFNFENNDVRTVEINNEPYFVAKDLCVALEVGNVSDALRRLDEDEKDIVLIDTLGGQQNMAIVNESGMYSLTLSSRKPEARRFKKWVTSVVLPAIRKTGSYSTQPAIPALPQNYTEALEHLLVAVKSNVQLSSQNVSLQQVNSSLLQENDRLLPKAVFAETMIENVPRGSIKIGEWIKSVDSDYGPKSIFKWLRNQHILFINNSGANLPYQTYLESGYFITRQYVYDAGSEQRLSTTTYITLKGQQWLIEKMTRAGVIRNQQFAIRMS